MSTRTTTDAPVRLDRRDFELPVDRSTRMTRMIASATGMLGSFPAILVAAGMCLAWLVGGLFVPGRWGNTAYQLPVSTISSIVTFLMVFVIQSSQNRDTRALQAKLDAQSHLLAELAQRHGVERAHLQELVRLVGIEDAPETQIREEQEQIRERTVALVQPDGGTEVPQQAARGAGVQAAASRPGGAG